MSDPGLLGRDKPIQESPCPKHKWQVGVKKSLKISAETSAKGQLWGWRCSHGDSFLAYFQHTRVPGCRNVPGIQAGTCTQPQVRAITPPGCSSIPAPWDSVDISVPWALLPSYTLKSQLGYPTFPWVPFPSELQTKLPSNLRKIWVAPLQT